MSYLYFVTLNTGSTSTMDAPDATVTHSAALDLGRALRDGRAPITAHNGYDLAVLTVGRSMLCTVYKGNSPLATFGVAAQARGAAKLWHMMHETAPNYGLKTDANNPPALPWCAVRVEPGLLKDFGASRWLASYELEIATAWIERRHRDEA
ncbi:hypothetical protein [Brucella sp. IR073]|uniref:hypothetical protein n=1 Tax=unclassified Brucella TaxID=2632610 RepID=UPI003B97DA7F